MVNKTLVALVGSAILAGAIDAKAEGVINLTNNIGNFKKNIKLVHEPGSTDGFDFSRDVSSGSSDMIYSSIPGYNLFSDSRDNSSKSPFVVNEVFEGQLSVPTTNYIQLGFTLNYKFQHKPNLTMRLLDTNGVSTTNVWNLKYHATNGTPIVLPNVPAGTYDIDHPINTFRVDFAPLVIPSPTLTSLVDNGNGTVNLGVTNTYEGVNYGIESSSDLMNWQNVSTNLNLSYPSATISNVPMPQVIVQTNSTNQSPTFENSPSGFYRVKVD